MSVENQTFADNRIPALLQHLCSLLFGGSPASLCLAPSTSAAIWTALIGLSMVGSPAVGAGTADPAWFRGIRDACLDAGVSYFHKQGNAHRPGGDRVLDGRTWDEMPEMLG